MRPASDFKNVAFFDALTANALLRKNAASDPPAVPFFFGERSGERFQTDGVKDSMYRSTRQHEAIDGSYI